jgi:hypothetical protein
MSSEVASQAVALMRGPETSLNDQPEILRFAQNDKRKACNSLDSIRVIRVIRGRNSRRFLRFLLLGTLISRTDTNAWSQFVLVRFVIIGVIRVLDGIASHRPAVTCPHRRRDRLRRRGLRFCFRDAAFAKNRKDYRER